MKVVKEIVERLGVENPEGMEYFDLNEKLRDKMVSIIWDDVYAEEYIRSYLPNASMTPLQLQFEIISYLMDILHTNEERGDYEVCDITIRLIKISENKIQEIDKHYADTNKEDR